MSECVSDKKRLRNLSEAVDDFPVGKICHCVICRLAGLLADGCDARKLLAFEVFEHGAAAG